jgi:hypothetical protein
MFCCFWVSWAKVQKTFPRNELLDKIGGKKLPTRRRGEENPRMISWTRATLSTKPMQGQPTAP